MRVTIVKRQATGATRVLLLPYRGAGKAAGFLLVNLAEGFDSLSGPSELPFGGQDAAGSQSYELSSVQRMDDTLLFVGRHQINEATDGYTCDETGVCIAVCDAAECREQRLAW